MEQWTTEAQPYPLRAMVYHNQKLWQSRIENNKEEPKVGNAWVELKADLTASDVGAYNKEEANQRFQPLGNYTPAGYSYSKEESDNRFQPKGNYPPVGNYALKGEGLYQVRIGCEISTGGELSNCGRLCNKCRREWKTE
ncbi:hypothetical protein [Xenorhabdus cabanillasii]|uniref:hypothetical protein n=1 Tax=Xenorhabdus cabanillasii TaxID=351673 RepID=UPI0038CD7F2F